LIPRKDDKRPLASIAKERSAARPGVPGWFMRWGQTVHTKAVLALAVF
jgi:hypothetical protein